MYCRNCGEELGTTANFCPFCGASVRGEKLEERNVADTASIEKLEILEKKYNEKKLEQEKRKQEIDNMINELKERQKQIIKQIDTMLNDTEKELISNFREKGSKGIKYCPNCGCYVGKSNFCGKCGMDVRGL